MHWRTRRWVTAGGRRHANLHRGQGGGQRRRSPATVMTPQLSHSSASYDPSPIPRIATLQVFREITLTSAILGFSKRVSGKNLRPRSDQH
jgi:hypothetical protein